MKRLILLIIILALALGLFAEEAIIGTGYETQRFPLGSYYGYERSAALYKADEIGAGSISISKLAWYATINTTASVPTKIYLKRTSASTLTASTWANMISGASLRYNQTKTGTGANGWNVYHLDSPFDLGMGENLIVMVETNYGGSGSDSAAGGGSGGGGIHSSFEYDTHLTWWGDNSAPTGNNNNNTPGLRPNVKLYYTNSDLTPSSLPFTEDWASGNLTSNDWTIEDNTWGVVSNLGNPAPSVRFNYSPHLSDYSSALYSRDFDARGMNSVEFSFDLYLDNHDDSVENVMSWEIWYGDTWISLGSYSSVDGDLPWTHYSYNISEISAIPMFKIRFLASGEQNFFINKWLIDNIYLGAPAAITLPFTEDWESLNFGTNFWTIDSENWRTFYVGENPDAAASFFYLPGVTDYSSALTSYDFDATGMSSVQFSFDLYLDNNSPYVENKMTWQIWNGSTWINLGSYSTMDGDLPWTHYSYDVSAHASNRIFKIRFVASGSNSYGIRWWYIDNVYLGEAPVPPIALPFTEDWASGNLTSNDWTIEDNTWGVVSNLGNPAPSVRFNYSPHLSDYSSALYSRDFDARGMNSVEFSFDLYLDNHDDSVENVMSWEIWYGDTWISLGSYSSVDGDLPWTHYSYNISEISAIPMFKIRFLASGEQNFFINKWLIDNIYLGAPAAITLPFTEDWESLNFGTNFWTIDSENWRTFYVGENPDAAASFFYLPGVTDYSSALTSYDFDATGMSSVQFSFDLFLDNHSTSAENKMTWQIWNGSTWHTLGSYSSLSDDLPWTHYSYDVSAYASNRIFKIRFVASGVDSYEINGWYIDNIKLGAPTGGLGTVTNLVISKSATRILLNGNSVPGATWYSVYYSEDPDGPFVLLGTVDTAIASFGINLSSLPGSKYFFKMTAGNGPWPSGSRLDNAPVSSSNIISQPDLTTNPQLNQSKPSKGLRPN